MNLFKEQCVLLRKKGYSLGQIVQATGKGKSSIYPYIKDIPLSRERLLERKIAAGSHIRKFALARKGKSTRPFKVFDEWSASTILLTSHLLFDGEIGRTRCAYNNRSWMLIERIEKLMKGLYEFEPIRYENKKTGVSRISYNNVALAAFMTKKAGELLQTVGRMSLNLQREFLRAFFDDEGCVDYRPAKKRRSIRGYQKNVKILNRVQTLLKGFNIDARIVLPNEVVIVGKENLMRFEQEINFSRGVQMNGNRSNSRWKKHMEKRNLLRLAIESFKN